MNPPLVLGLGSNDVQALSWLRRAVAALKKLAQEEGWRITAVSGIYASNALLPEGAPREWDLPYLNLCVALDPGKPFPPQRLLSKIKQLEVRLGRRQRQRWAPREIDIDLLAWGETQIQSPELNLPHAGLLSRPFALLPLAEVASLDFWPQARDLARKWAPFASAARTEPPSAHEVPFRTRRTMQSLTELVAILNLTPDSFSDGGALADEEAVFQAATLAIREGATFLDWGAESTRPGATPISVDEEWKRLAPALALSEAFRREGVRISVDSRNPATIRRALESGSIDWINDVGGLEAPGMLALAKESGLDCVVMHSLGVPPRRDVTLPPGEDAVQAILEWGTRKLEALSAEGLSPERVILDPGLGFGKTPEQNFALLAGASRLHEWGTRLLVGHSRKSFIGSIGGHAPRPPRDRDLETAILTAELAFAGVEYLRVHDVPSQARALLLAQAAGKPSRWT